MRGSGLVAFKPEDLLAVDPSWYPTLLRACYATSGTHIASRATRCLVLTSAMLLPGAVPSWTV
eukprot:1845110-Rhodomonas_salina.2